MGLKQVLSRKTQFVDLRHRAPLGGLLQFLLAPVGARPAGESPSSFGWGQFLTTVFALLELRLQMDRKYA